MRGVYTVIIFFLLTLFFPGASVSATQDVTLQLQWKHQFQFAGYYAAKEKNFYARNQLRVAIKEGDGVNVVKEVVSGRAQFGIGDVSLLKSRAEHEPIVVLAAIFQHTPIEFIASEQSGITNVHQLAKAKIAIEENTLALQTFLLSEGISLKNLTTVPHQMSTEQLLNGQVDAMSAYATDEAYSLQQKNVKFVRFTPMSSGLDFYGDCLFTSEDMLRKQPEVVAQFVAASLRGWKYAFRHQNELAMTIYNDYSTRHSMSHLLFEAREMEKYVLPEVVELGYMNRGRWQSIVETQQRLGLLPASFSLHGFLYDDYLKTDLQKLRPYIIVTALIFSVLATWLFIYSRINRRLNDEIAQRKLAEDELRLSEQRYRSLAEYAPFPIVIFDEETLSLRYANSRAIAIFGDRAYALLRQCPFMSLLTARTNLVDKELQLSTVNNEPFDAYLNATTISFEGVPSYFIAFNDITSLNETKRLLLRNREELLLIADSLPMLVFHVDDRGICRFANLAFNHWLGLERSALVEQPIRDALPEPFEQQLAEYLSLALAGEAVHFDSELTFIDGTIHDIHVELLPRFEDDVVHSVYVIATDVSHFKEQEEQLRELASIDALTNLYNRREFLVRLAKEFDRFKRYNAPFSLMMIDLDHFKAINDTFGHDYGDLVLQTTAQLLQQQLRSSDILCRYGGEEFFAILPETSHEEALALAERLREHIAGTTFSLNGERLAITASFGVTTTRQSDEKIEALLKQADVALYTAKRGGRNRVEAL